MESHHQSVQDGQWANCPNFSYWNGPIVELAYKTIGIVGFGNIGQRVATIAQGFGMKVIAHHKHPERDARPNVTFTDLETLFKTADVVSLHCSLNAQNKEFVNADLLQLMKPSAYLINTARGGLIHEKELLHALQNNMLAGAALDVLSEEPPVNGNVLFDAPNCLITPHNAWASIESRSRLMTVVADNLKGFLNGKLQNVIR